MIEIIQGTRSVCAQRLVQHPLQRSPRHGGCGFQAGLGARPVDEVLDSLQEASMSQSLEWRLARTFVRCYSLVLLINFTHAIVGPLFGFRFIGYTSQGAIWDLGLWLGTISTLEVFGLLP